jgi:hypothetical protein
MPQIQVPKLNEDVRRLLWTLLYRDEPPRLVEVQTAKHDCHHGVHYCPRFSPSPRPTVVNICREARDEANRIARIAGHIIFDTHFATSPIYFKREIDTLYVPNEKDNWIRDFYPPGILTQFKREHSPESVSRLALGLDPVFRGTSVLSLRLDLQDFVALRDLIFIIKELDDEIIGHIRQLNLFLKRANAAAPLVQQRSGSEHLRTYPKECILALKRGALLEFVQGNLSVI